MLESLFNIVAGLGLQLYIKETPKQVFSFEIFEIFVNTFFYRTHPVAASVNSNIEKKHYSV